MKSRLYSRQGYDSKRLLIEKKMEHKGIKAEDRNYKKMILPTVIFYTIRYYQCDA